MEIFSTIQKRRTQWFVVWKLLKGGRISGVRRGRKKCSAEGNRRSVKGFLKSELHKFSKSIKKRTANHQVEYEDDYQFHVFAKRTDSVKIRKFHGIQREFFVLSKTALTAHHSTQQTASNHSQLQKCMTHTNESLRSFQKASSQNSKWQ